MEHYVFNGDADGLCALQQLRLATPDEPNISLITGVKRDIALLQLVTASAGDRVTVLDITLDQNQEALLRLLANGVIVRYFDHHTASNIPTHPNFAPHIEVTVADQGTSLLVDNYLGRLFPAWAVVGTFGDNFNTRASEIAAALGYTPEQTTKLRTLGVLLNYNGYGLTIEDLHIPPAILAAKIQPYVDPLEFIQQDASFALLNDGYHQDMSHTVALQPALMTERHGLYLLPDAPWVRRVSGVFANKLAQEAPQRAHALLTHLPTGGFLVSVRAPLAAPKGADTLCRQFPSGGGRKAAAGINVLPSDLYSTFSQAFIEAF